MQEFPISQLLWAGAISGVAGLFTFLIVHHFTIRPIWFIAPPGLLLAVGGGAAVGWAFQLLQTRLGPNLLIASLALAALLTLTQVPGFLIGSTREPILDMTTATVLPGKGAEAAWRFGLDLFLTAATTGALIGWVLGAAWQPRAHGAGGNGFFRRTRGTTFPSSPARAPRRGYGRSLGW